VFLVSSCLLVGRSAVQWADFEFQTVFGSEQLPFFGRSAVRWADCDVHTVTGG
jgi:hypothetical protein